MSAAPDAGFSHRLQADGAYDHDVFTFLALELGNAVIDEAYAAFVQDTRDRLRALDLLALYDSRLAIARHAHVLVGTAGLFGFPRLARRARDLEQASPLISQAEYRKELTQLQAAFARGQADRCAAICGGSLA